MIAVSKRTRLIGALALHLALITAPAVAWLFGLPDALLVGVQPPQKSAPLSWAGWRDGEVQAGMTRSMESHLGLRGVFIRTDNSLQTLTGEAKAGSGVVIGDHDTLYVIDDLRSYSRRPEAVPNLERVRDLADLVADVQARLQREGTPLVVIMSPSKTSIYPEDVPARWRMRAPGGVEQGIAPVNAFRERLRERGAPFTDGATLLNARIAGNEAERERVFSKKARHWSPVGACAVLQSALAPFLAFACEPRTFLVPIVDHWDRDLLVLLNRWERVTEEDGFRPPQVKLPDAWLRPLVVGTSFSWGLVEWLRVAAADSVRYFYYNSSVHEATTTTTTMVGKVDPTSPSWERFVGDRNFFILEVLESALDGEYMRGFLVAMRDRKPAPP